MWKKCGRAAENFEGEHDFKAFKASGTSSKSTVRTIYKMVRIISGTLVDVGVRKIKTRRNTRNYQIKRPN